MSERIFFDGRVRAIHGDCRDAIQNIADASVDSVVTDGPYALVSIVKRFGKDNAAPARAKEGCSGVYMRASAGFMGQRWDTGEVYFDVAFWREVMRVLKPGGHVVAFAGTRTYHRLACAIEDAGFEIRDQIAWLYGSGFPKSHDVAKGIDKTAGLWRGRAGKIKPETIGQVAKGTEYERTEKGAPITAAAAWEGWGTALKPALEPICLARKPFKVSVAKNVLENGTGALNIDACRIPMSDDDASYIAERIGGFNNTKSIGGTDSGILGGGKIMDRAAAYDASKGRWPANVVHDGSDEAIESFPNSAGQQGDVRGTEPSDCHSGIYSGPRARGGTAYEARNDAGSAARFFYSAKADALDRLGSNHPTVKPVALMRWLVRLVTPKRVVEFVCETCNNTPYDSAAKISPDPPLCDVPDAVQAEGQQAHRKVLQPSMCGEGAQTTGESAMRALRGNVSSSQGRTEAVLLADLCDEVGGTAQAQAAHQNNSRLSSVLPSWPSDGDQDGICDGAPSNNGGASWEKSFAERGGASHQRNKGRQPDRKSGRDDEGIARPNQEAAQADDNQMPPLQRAHQAKQCCEKCGFPLVRVERPGVVLDPFAGTGTTGIAVMAEGFEAILIEREDKFFSDIGMRFEHAQGRGILSGQLMTRNKRASAEKLPLFERE